MTLPLIPARLALATSTDYTGCPDIQAIIMENAEERLLNVQARIKELADREAETQDSVEYRILPVAGEKKRHDRTAWLRACIP